MRSTRRKEMENPRFQLREAELLLFTTSLKEYVCLSLSLLLIPFFFFLKENFKKVHSAVISSKFNFVKFYNIHENEYTNLKI